MREAIARKLQAAARRVDAIGRDGRGDPTDYDEYRLVLTGEERDWLIEALEMKA
jgi:hypothetical protein